MLAKESRVCKGLELGGGEFAPAGTWHVAIWHRPVIYITYIGTLSHFGCNVFILVRTLTALLRESKKVTSEESSNLKGSPAVNSGPESKKPP